MSDRTVKRRSACLHRRNGIYYIHSPNDFPKDGILLVQMGRTAELPIYETFIFRDFPAFQPKFLNGIKPRIREPPPLDDIPLTSAACPGRIDVITRPRRPKGASFMKKCRPEFGGYRIPRPFAAALAQRLARIPILAIRITRLDHEMADHPMKKKTVIITALCQPQKIVPVQRGGIRQPDNDYSFAGADLDIFFQVLFP